MPRSVEPARAASGADQWARRSTAERVKYQLGSRLEGSGGSSVIMGTETEPPTRQGETSNSAASRQRCPAVMESPGAAADVDDRASSTPAELSARATIASTMRSR